MSITEAKNTDNQLEEIINDIAREHGLHNPIIYSVYSLYVRFGDAEGCIKLLIGQLINSLNNTTQRYREHLERCPHIAPIILPKGAKLID